ncbi:MAG: hypothetical protein L0Z50_14390, partial [Verrucomicrobiales bacterium]|nr:hypothetical protein [Verrucomicrobiales bacterium]
MFELLAEADAMAGGDAGQFLKQYIVGLEEELTAFEAELGEGTGNAPPYPVLYMAEIVRGTNTLTLRGETGPFGQYSLFVPRDGELLHVSFYDPRTKRIGNAFPRLRPAAPHRMRRCNLEPVDETFLDGDGDGLADVVEFVYGTDYIEADSDRDGIADGAEVEQGTNPLDGLAVQTGIIATARTPGPAVDVWAGNDLVATAEGTAGVSLFNAYQGMNPTIVAHVSTPGNAQRISGAGNFIAVATGEAGLSIIDISIPAEALISHQVPMTGAQAVVAVAGKAYAGLASGDIAVVDLATGVVLDG